MKMNMRSTRTSWRRRNCWVRFTTLNSVIGSVRIVEDGSLVGCCRGDGDGALYDQTVVGEQCEWKLIDSGAYADMLYAIRPLIRL